MKMHYDARNNHIYCTNAFACKDALKSLGFKFNSMAKTWFIAMPKDITTLGNLICDVTVDCNVDYYDFCDFISLHLPAEYAEVMMHMDAAHVAKLQAAFEH